MFYLTDLIAKPVISLSEGIVLGTVENAVFDKKLKKLKYLSVFNEDKEDKIYVPVNYILNAMNTAVIIKSNPVLEDTLVFANSPLRAAVYLYDGSVSGYISDIALNDNLSIVNLKKDDESTLEIKNIISFSCKAVVVCFDNDKLISLKKIKPRKPVIKKEISEPQTEIVNTQNYLNQTHLNNETIREFSALPVGIKDFSADIMAEIREISADLLNDLKTEKAANNAAQDTVKTTAEQITLNNIITKEPAVDNAEAEQLPENITASESSSENPAAPQAEEDIYCLRNIVPLFNYLIGRKSTEDILNQKNEIIVPKNTVITIEHIDKCRKFGKLLLLARYNK